MRMVIEVTSEGDRLYEGTSKVYAWCHFDFLRRLRWHLQ